MTNSEETISKDDNLKKNAPMPDFLLKANGDPFIKKREIFMDSPDDIIQQI